MVRISNWSIYNLIFIEIYQDWQESLDQAKEKILNWN